MNKHINKNKKQKPVAQNRAAVEPPESMPREVAESLLLTPGTRLTNRMRKNCHAARVEDIFCSTLEPKSLAEQLTRKLKTATASQLAKWAMRTLRRRGKLEKNLNVFRKQQAQVTKDTPRMVVLGLQVGLEQLTRQAVATDTFMSCLESEAKSRLKTLCKAATAS